MILLLRRTAWNIPFHELIGLKIHVLSHPDPALVGIAGIVVEETKNTLVVSTGDRCIRVIKHHGLFLFKLHGTSVVLRGEEILGDPAERLKRLEKTRGVRWLVRKGKERRYSWG